MVKDRLFKTLTLMMNHLDRVYSPDDYNCDISLARATQGRGFKANGTLLFEVCKRSGFPIVNGRVGEDFEFGKCTYVSSFASSLIKCVIAGKVLFRYITTFCVLVQT